MAAPRRFCVMGAIAAAAACGPTASTTDATTGSTSGDHETGPTPCGSRCFYPWETEGSLTVVAGDELSQYACLTRVRGAMKIEGLSSAELRAFASLRQVDGTLKVSGPEVTDLAALACLEAVGRLSLESVPALTDAPTLAGLKSAPQVTLRETGLAALPTFAPEYAGIAYLEVSDNPALVDLAPAMAWAGIDSLSLAIADNEALTDISGLAGPLTTAPYVEYVRLVGLPALASLEGLEAPLDGAVLELRDLPLVPNLAPLAKITRLLTFAVTGLPRVTSLAGLHNLESAFVIHVGDCGSETAGMPGLTDLSGLDALAGVRVLSAVNNPGLTSLAGAPHLKNVGRLDLVNNPELGDDDVAALVTQLWQPPDETCLGGWDTCECSAYWID